MPACALKSTHLVLVLLDLAGSCQISKTLPQACSITVTHHSVSDALLGIFTSHLHSQSTHSVQSSSGDCDSKGHKRVTPTMVDNMDVEVSPKMYVVQDYILIYMALLLGQ